MSETRSENIKTNSEELVTVKASNEAIGDNKVSLKIPSRKEKLIAAVEKVCKVLGKNYTIISTPDNSDIPATGISTNNLGCKDYYFESVNLPSYLVSPELLEIIINRVFIKIPGSCQSENCSRVEHEFILRSEYESYPYLGPNNSMMYSSDLCIHLSPTLLYCCRKYIESKYHSRYYCILGYTEVESLEQRMENFIVSGRADRVISRGSCMGPTGPCEQDTVYRILKENGKYVKTANVLQGSFDSFGGVKAVQDRWIRVVVD